MPAASGLSHRLGQTRERGWRIGEGSGLCLLPGQRQLGAGLLYSTCGKMQQASWKEVSSPNWLLAEHGGGSLPGHGRPCAAQTTNAYHRACGRACRHGPFVRPLACRILLPTHLEASGRRSGTNAELPGGQHSGAHPGGQARRPCWRPARPGARHAIVTLFGNVVRRDLAPWPPACHRRPTGVRAAAAAAARAASFILQHRLGAVRWKREYRTQHCRNLGCSQLTAQRLGTPAADISVNAPSPPPALHFQAGQGPGRGPVPRATSLPGQKGGRIAQPRSRGGGARREDERQGACWRGRSMPTATGGEPRQTLPLHGLLR